MKGKLKFNIVYGIDAIKEDKLLSSLHGNVIKCMK